MIKKFLINLKVEDKHPPEETLLRCADGELTPRQAARVRAHLETCWTCRAQLDKIEEAISQFVEFRRMVQLPLIESPPSNWNGFGGKLTLLAGEKSIKKTGRRWRLLSWQRFFDFSWASGFSPLWIRSFAGATLVLLLIAVLVWQLTIVQPVSASELLEKSIAAQSKNISATEQPVVYQKLQVKKQSAPAVNLEIWQDATRQRFRQSVNYSNTDASLPGKTDRGALSNLSEILRSNGMDPERPLSPSSFKAWRDSLADKTDEVGRNGSGEASYLSLRTVNRAATSAGQISEAILKVRESDWHPFAETLRVRTSDGEDTFELTELEFQVNSLTAFGADFFDEQATLQIATLPNPLPATNPGPLPSPSVESSPIEAAKPEAAAKPVATLDLEVEALRLLNQVQADLGEQITVTRENDGVIYVRGIVETPQRKGEIISALGAIENNPAVRVEINTVAEAVAKEKTKQQQQPEQVESVETQRTSIAAENDLIEHLGSAQAARAFAAESVNLSTRVLGRAYALRRLAGQFKPEELRKMSPDARAKWLGLIKQHATAFRQESENLRGKLGQAFDEPDVSSSAAASVREVDDVPRAIEVLIGLASANDRVVRSAMTVSAGDTQFTAIKTAQFWQSLKTAEALAAKLQAVK